MAKNEFSRREGSQFFPFQPLDDFSAALNGMSRPNLLLVVAPFEVQGFAPRLFFPPWSHRAFSPPKPRLLPLRPRRAA